MVLGMQLLCKNGTGQRNNMLSISLSWSTEPELTNSNIGYISASFLQNRVDFWQTA